MKNTKSDDLPIWGNLHEAIRWVLYFPVVLGLSYTFIFLFTLLCTFLGDFEGVFLYLQTTFNTGLMTTLFVWLALNLSPRAPKTSAWTIYSIWSIPFLLSIIRFFGIAFVFENMAIQQRLTTGDVKMTVSRVIPLNKDIFYDFSGYFRRCRMAGASKTVGTGTVAAGRNFNPQSGAAYV